MPLPDVQSQDVLSAVTLKSEAVSEQIPQLTLESFRPGVAAPRIQINIINSNKNKYHRDFEHIQKFCLHSRIRLLELSTCHLFYSEFVKGGVCLFNLFGPINMKYFQKQGANTDMPGFGPEYI
jgi:hypothetical protein